jgi:hypothetical protein
VDIFKTVLNELHKYIYAKRTAVAALVVIFLAIWFSIWQSAPAAVVEPNVSDTSFSVHRAFIHLKKISSMPHMIGTASHEVVKQYIVDQCKAMGFEVSLQEAIPVTENWGGLQAAYVQNIVAVKKGSASTKAVVLMSHYDSEPNTAGAGDDGSSVAAMLETAHNLQRVAPLKNDLILLFTDGEEIGLMGATAFLNESPLAKNIGVMLNFEARGNKGPSNMFEVNEDNGWVMSHYAAAAAKPFANSLGYEVYKKLPNGTDFTVFKNVGITGLNSAFIDGYENYHSPTDIPDNLDLRSMQHHGVNMLSLVKHFGNLEIKDTKAPNLSYFNALGNWFIHYPAAWNIYLVGLVNLLLLYFVFALVRKKLASIGEMILSLAVFTAVVVGTFFITKFLLGKIIDWYPMYSHFHDYGSYNSKWYFLAMSFLALFVFALVYAAVSKRMRYHSLLAGILFLVTVLLDLMYYAIPTASFLFSIPLLFLLGGQLFLLRKLDGKENLSQTVVMASISVLPAIFILCPIVYFTFIAFGLGDNMTVVTAVTALVVGLLFPVWRAFIRQFGFGLAGLAFVCFVTCLIVADQRSGYDSQHPLQTAIRYEENVSTQKGKWISAFTDVDPWTKQFFANAVINMQSWDAKMERIVPSIGMAAPEAVLLADSASGDKRFLKVRFTATRQNVVGLSISIKDSSKVSSVNIQGKWFDAEKSNGNAFHDYLRFTGDIPGGPVVVFQLPIGRKLEMTVRDRSIGLPAIQGFDSRYPVGIIPSASYSANTVQVKKDYSF